MNMKLGMELWEGLGQVGAPKLRFYQPLCEFVSVYEEVHCNAVHILGS